jgi:hypothetical protein
MKSKTSTSSSRARGHQRAEAGPRPRRISAEGQPLTRMQKARLAQEAAAAFAHQEKAGLVEVAPTASRSAALDDWRREQLAAAGFPASLAACTNHQFRAILALFLTLAGREPEAFSIYLRTGRVKDRGAEEDTHERREELRKLILASIMEHGEKVTKGHPRYDAAIAATVEKNGGMIGARYCIAIAKAKCKGRPLETLTAAELSQLLYTMRNRITAREGRGKTAERNKSQRKTKQP